MLFYVLTILAWITKQADLLFVVLAWIFVALRLLHAAIHVTSNHCRSVCGFCGSVVVLAIMWTIFSCASCFPDAGHISQDPERGRHVEILAPAGHRRRRLRDPCRRQPPPKAAPNTTSNLTADVCVVGAGFAGLAAALRLKQAGASVVVLEARDQVGGRSWTNTMKDGALVDWGGQWVGSSQERFYALIKEMGCETYPSPNFGKTLQRSIIDTNEYHRIDEDKDEAYPGSECQGRLQADRCHRRHRRRERAVGASGRQAARLR